MGKRALKLCADCLLFFLSTLTPWLFLFCTDTLNIQWQRTSCLCKSRCRGGRGSGSHQDRDSFRGPEQRARKVRKFLWWFRDSTFIRFHSFFCGMCFLLSLFLVATPPPQATNTLYCCWLWLVRLWLVVFSLACPTNPIRGPTIPKDLPVRKKNVFKCLRGTIEGSKLEYRSKKRRRGFPSHIAGFSVRSCGSL